MTSVSVPPRHRMSFRVEMGCQLTAVRAAVSAVISFLKEQGFEPEELSASELALVEACNNAIEHVAPERQALPVVVEAISDTTELELRVEDHTAGFQWPSSPNLPPDDCEHGRGLFLMHALMSSVDYLRGSSRNCLVLRRKRSESGSVVSPVASFGRLQAQLDESEKIIRDMADELSSCYESLSAIFRYSGEQSRSVGMEDFTRRLLGDLLQVTGNSWYLFRLFDAASNQLAVGACSIPDLPMPALSLSRTNPAEPVPMEVQAVHQHRDCWFDRGEDLHPDDPLIRFGSPTSGWIHPLHLGDELVGTLAVGGGTGGRRFTAAHTSVVQTFADFLAIQVVNARLQDQRLRSLLVAQELEIARKIQRSLLPTTLPQFPGLMLLGHCESASEVGGDFFDVIPLSETTFLLVVCDVMGKGLPAAMFAMIVRSLLRALRDRGPQPGQLLHRTNDLLYEELSRVEMFITAQATFVDAQSGQLTVANAGHCPLLYCPGPGRPVEAIAPDGMPLGVLKGTEFVEEKWTLEQGGRLIMYTDGVTETAEPGGEFFGQTRLAAWLANEVAGRAATDSMKDRLRNSLARHQGSPALVDDQTFVILGR